MLRVLGRRLIWSIPVAFFATIIVFGLLHVSPGDPAIRIAGGIDADPAVVEAVREQLGLNKPFLVQYYDWISRAVRGDLGTSLGRSLRVTEAISRALPPTISLTFVALVIALIVAVPLGLVGGKFYHSTLARWISGLTSLGIATPSFFAGVVLAALVARRVEWIPATGYTPISEGLGPWLAALILPSLALAAQPAAELTRYIMASLNTSLQEEYIRMARSKGLGELAVTMKHAGKTAAIPVVTVYGLQLRNLLSGATVIEIVFGIPGLGKLLVDTVFARDYYVLQGVMVFVVLMVLAINLLVDLTYSSLDPRVRSE